MVDGWIVDPAWEGGADSVASDAQAALEHSRQYWEEAQALSARGSVMLGLAILLLSIAAVLLGIAGAIAWL